MRGRRLAAGAVVSMVMLGAVWVSLAVAGGSGTTAAPLPKVAVILYGPANDGGWNTMWGNAVKQLKTSVPGVQVTVVPNVNPGAASQRTMMGLARQGYGLVVATGGYPDTDLQKAADAYPRTQFMNLFGTRIGKNLSPFDIGLEDSRYLDGVLAGLMTKSNIIGEVGGYPIPVEIRTLNAFALGVRSVNPEAKIKILWVNSFYDPTKESQAAQALVGAGADVLVMDSNTPAVSSVARARDVYFIGYGISRAADAPKNWLGAFSFNWAPYLVAWTRAVQQGTFKQGLFYEGLSKGAVGRTAYGSSVPKSVIAKINDVKERIRSGSLKVFKGPIKSNAGKTVVPAGSTISTPAKLSACCTWYASNVEGNSSSK